MRKAVVFILIFSVLSLVFISFTSADTTEGIQPENPSEYGVFDLGEIYVTAEKLPTSEEASITIEITAEDIESTNSKTIGEALSHVPGIRVSTGRKNEQNIQIHGFDQSNTLILIDGVPYYETNFGRLDLSQIPIDNIAKIEITEGGSSVLYGPNALAGVINIITKKPTSKPSGEVILEAGENATYKASLSHGMKIGIFNYWLNYTHQESNGWRMSDDFKPRMGSIVKSPGGTTQAILENGGFRNNSDYNNNSFWAKVGIEPNQNSEYYVNFHYLSRGKGYPSSVDSVQVFNSRPYFSHFGRITRYDDWGIDLSGQQKITEQLTLKGKLFYHNHVDDYTSYSDQTYSEEISVSTYKDYMAGVSFTADYKPVNWDIMRSSVNYRGDSHKERDDTYLPFAESFSYTGSIGFENEFNKLKNLSLVAGISYDWFRIDKAERNITDKPTGDFLRQDNLGKPDTMEELNPMIGATYKVDEATRLFGSIARKVRFPTLQQLYSTKGGNIDLNAERSINYTIGVSRSFGDFARGEFAFFYYDVSDFISRDAPGPLGGTYHNVGKIEIYGIELNGEICPTKDLIVGAGYTYDHARDRSEGRVTDKVTNIPEHKVDIKMAYTIPYIITNVNVTGTYVAEVYSQLPTPQKPQQEAIKTGDYFIVDTRISKTLMKKYEAYVAINNIFDKNYESEAGFPSPGRNFFVGISAKF